MALAIATVVTLTVLGLPLTLLLDRQAAGGMLPALSFLLGSALIFAVMFMLSLAGVGWSLPLILGSALSIASAAGVALRRLPGQTIGTLAAAPLAARGIAPVVDAVTAGIVIVFALYATATPLRAWDFWAIWGLKGRVFFELGGIDWRFLESNWNEFAHRDYPLLLPLNLTFAGMMNGGWDDRWMGVLFVAFGASLLLIIRALASREVPPSFAAAITLGTAPFALSPDIGMAEGPLVAYAATGVLMIRRALGSGDDAALRFGALLLGLAACCKNEGVLLIAAVAVAMLSTDPRHARRVLQLWPAVVVAAPWKVIAAMHSLSMDLTQGDAGARLMQRIGAADAIAAALLSALNDRWPWVAILIGLLLVPAVERRRERFVLAVTAFQASAYVAAYFLTPHDALWHIANSWHRLTRQLGAPMVFVVVILLTRFAIEREGHDNIPSPS